MGLNNLPKITQLVGGRAEVTNLCSLASDSDLLTTIDIKSLSSQRDLRVYKKVKYKYVYF